MTVAGRLRLAKQIVMGVQEFCAFTANAGFGMLTLLKA